MKQKSINVFEAQGSSKLTITQKQKIIKQYTPLIRFVAKKIAIRLPANINIEDLVSNGVIGLIDAIEKYDPSRDNKFKTYAEFRIRGAILDELRSQDWVPRSVRDKTKILERATAYLESNLGYPPTDPEIAEHMGLTINEFYNLVNQVRPVNVLSIDEASVFSSVDRKSFLNLLKVDSNPFSSLNVKSTKTIINKLITELPERQKMILTLYYYEGFNLKKIGTILNITESRVSQLHTQAIKRLKTKMQTIFTEQEIQAA